MAKKENIQETAEETIARLKAENAELRGTVKDQAEELQVAEATKPKNAKPVISNGGERYTVDHGVRIKTKTYTRDELAKDQALCAQLIAKGSTAFTKLALKK
jgi:hypothetical protein